MVRGQVQLEFLIVFPVLLLVILGAVQLSLIIAARSSLSAASYAVAREIMMNPVKVLHSEKGEISGEKLKLLAIKNLIPLSPPLSEVAVNSLGSVGGFLDLKKVADLKEKLGNLFNQLKNRGPSELVDALDRAIYAAIFTKVKIIPPENFDPRKIKEAVSKGVFNDISIPFPFEVTVDFNYPLLPVFGKIYCTKFTISRGEIEERVEDWIDDQMGNVNMFISEKVEEYYSKLLTGIGEGVREFSDSFGKIAKNFSDQVSSFTSGIDNLMDSFSGYVTRVSGYCSDLTAVTEKIQSKINTKLGEIDSKINDFENLCLSAGDDQFDTVINRFNSVAGEITRVENEIKRGVRSVKGYGLVISNTIAEGCGEIEKIEIPSIPEFNVPSCEEINLPCDRADIDFKDYYPPSVSYEEYISYFGTGRKVLDGYRRITSSTVRVINRVEERKNEIIDICSKSVNEGKRYCEMITDEIVEGAKNIQGLSGKAKVYKGEILRNCGKIGKELDSWVEESEKISASLDYAERVSRSVYGRIEEFREKREKFCSMSAGKLRQFRKFIVPVVEKINSMNGRIVGICRDDVGEFVKKYRKLSGGYISLKKRVNSYLEKIKNVNTDPVSYLDNIFQNKLQSFWSRVYGYENSIKGEVRSFLERNIPDFPQFSVVDKDRCNPYLYYLGIYAVKLSSSEIVPVNFASLKGLTEDERKRIH